MKHPIRIFDFQIGVLNGYRQITFCRRGNRLLTNPAGDVTRIPLKTRKPDIKLGKIAVDEPE